MLKKADVILIIAFLLLTAAVAAWSVGYFGKDEGAEVVITVGGKLYGTYPLSEDREIRTAHNILIIQDGKTYMAEADCRDQYCVHHAPISKQNEEIICLPNRVVVRIQGGAEGEVDVIG